MKDSPTEHEEGQDMPKIRRQGGGSDASDVTTEPALGAAAPEPDTETETGTAEGGEQSSRGTSSSESSERPEQSEKPSSPDPRRRARTTGSRSSVGRTGSSTARTTGGDRTDDDG